MEGGALNVCNDTGTIKVLENPMKIANKPTKPIVRKNFERRLILFTVFIAAYFEWLTTLTGLALWRCSVLRLRTAKANG